MLTAGLRPCKRVTTVNSATATMTTTAKTMSQRFLNIIACLPACYSQRSCVQIEPSEYTVTHQCSQARLLCLSGFVNSLPDTHWGENRGLVESKKPATLVKATGEPP